MRASSVAVPVAVVLALVGCQVGCDGERAQKTKAPRAAVTTSDATTHETATTQLPASIGNLDAPAGSLDPLFGSLAAAERGDPSGRTLMLFFGDSHTAGDSM